MAAGGLARTLGPDTGRRRHRSTTALALLAAGALVVLAGCAGGGAADGAVDMGAPVGESVGDRAAVEPQADEATAPETTGLLLPAQRSVIATASREIRVADVATTLPLLTVVARSAGGYVASEDSATDPDDPSRMTAVVVLRIPNDRLSAALDQLADLGEELTRRQDVQDVTEQVVDVDSRVASARASVQRIRVLLSRAESIGDIVRIESELAQREAILESMLAQQRSLREQTTYATVDVTLVGAETPAATDPDSGFLVGLQRGWDAFTAAVAWSLTVVGVLVPFLVLLGVVGLPVAAALRRRRSAPAPDGEAAGPELVGHSARD